MPFDLATLVAIVLYLLIILLPGLTLVTLLRPVVTDPAVRLGLAVGLGLAVQPLAYLWASLLGLRLGPAFWWLVLVTSAMVVAGGAYRQRANWRGHRPGPPQWALLGILATLLAVRWWAASDLTVPLWGDSYQHSLMVRLFLEQGGLPIDWRPYAELSTFTYHFGLHGGVTTLAWLSGLPPQRALLVAGQVLMVLQALTLYALAAGLSGRPWAGVGAALAAAGLGPMPGYYLNWGRYTQLAGQVLLPAAGLLAAMAPLPRPWRSWPGWRPVVLAGIAVAGLALTHYLVTVFFALLALAWVLVGPAPGKPTGAAARLAGLVPVAAAGLLLAGPWVPRFLYGVLDDMALRLATTRVGSPEVFGIVAPEALWGSPVTVDHHLGLLLLAVGAVAAAYGIWRRDRLTLLGLLWAALMLLAAYPGLVGLPVSGVVKDFTVAIALYLPLGLVLGGGLGAVTARPWAGRPGVAPAVATAIVAGVVVLGWGQREVAEPQYVLVTPADEAAMAWIVAHTPAAAVFLVSSFDAFGDTVQAGDDAGWWIPALTGRRTTVPPITLGTERAFDPTYRQRVNRLAAACRADVDGSACVEGLDEAGVAFAYLGPTGHSLPRARLTGSRNWRVVFDHGGATVLERQPGAGPR